MSTNESLWAKQAPARGETASADTPSEAPAAKKKAPAPKKAKKAS
jgi:hypothetical protein